MIRAAFWLSVLGVTVASLMPVAMLPPQVFDIWDKAQHAFAFAWLGLLGLVSYPARPVRPLLGLLALGGAIELAQAATGWRYGEWMDFAADGVGIALGTAVWVALRARTTARA